jgi:outer membrane protein assembly factor BamE (lipoprotein component of BamABCDE complex)
VHRRWCRCGLPTTKEIHVRSLIRIPLAGLLFAAVPLALAAAHAGAAPKAYVGNFEDKTVRVNDSGGRVESIDLLDKIQPGVTTAQQVRELLGPPARTMHFPARGLDALEYEARDYSDRLIVSISIGSDGVVREVMRLRQSGA